MLVGVFPSDRKLPQCAAIMAGGDPAVETAMLSTLHGHGWTIDRRSIEPVRYREHLSLVARYVIRARRTHPDATAERTFYVKTYAEREAARRAFDHLTELSGRAAAGELGVRIDAPVACFDHLNAVLLPCSSGEPLSDVIFGASDAAAVRAVRQAARGLAAFHLSVIPTRRCYPPADYVRSLERPVTILEWACPSLRDVARAVLASAAAAVCDVELCPTHRDMKPEHVLLGPEGIALIDMDSCAAADPVLDVALMLARFTGARISGELSAHRADAVASAFRDEYFACAPRSWCTRLSAYYASSLLEVAAGIFHRQRDHWQRRVGELVELATRVGCRRPRSR